MNFAAYLGGLGFLFPTVAIPNMISVIIHFSSDSFDVMRCIYKCIYIAAQPMCMCIHFGLDSSKVTICIYKCVYINAQPTYIYTYLCIHIKRYLRHVATLPSRLLSFLSLQ